MLSIWLDTVSLFLSIPIKLNCCRNPYSPSNFDRSICPWSLTDFSIMLCSLVSAKRSDGIRIAFAPSMKMAFEDDTFINIMQ
ncbi:MAG: hypothetical protein ACTSO2_16820 [Promethearchaeota archaeon]